MKHKIFSKALSLTAAAAICCSTLPSLGGFSAAAASVNPDKQEVKCYRNNSNDIVSVIVKVKGDAVMEQPAAEELGADYLDTAQAAQLTTQLESAQRRVQNSIRFLYPELEISYSYQVLVNGFACELPEKLIPEVAALPQVESVTKVTQHIAPKMSKAAALSGFPAYFDQTGCSGEGQVVCVIDSELDVTHPMFAPLAEDIETALSKEDITEIINSGTLNVDVDPERAYISSKLPYVIDYAGDPYEGVPEPDAYHGTHVSGIAAGNEFVDPDGNTISGIAKDAQIIFMGTSAGGGYIDDAAALAATEDAVKLRADVINMSWGDELEYFGENPISEALINAENAGIMICIAAGNSDNGASMYGRVNKASSPDVSTMNGMADKGVGAMFVASADNNMTIERHTFYAGDERIVYRPTISYDENYNSEEIYLDSMMEPGEYEYVDCGSGSYDEIQAANVEGKIALIQRGTVYFDEMLSAASEFGARGIIISDNEIPDGLPGIQTFFAALPAAVVTFEEGQALREAENKIIRVSDETVVQDIPTQVSEYTSWGVKQSLDLRPDIMGVGGNVESAAYEQGVATLSGTSMATPYLSGCVAVMRQHMEKLDLGLEGKDKVKYIRNLLMDSAIPYMEGDMYVTPRRQGAGLVSLDKMLADKVIVTGAEGEAKVNLYDNLGEQFSFDINLDNISSEDVTFTNAKLLLTTDSSITNEWYNTEEISGQQVLNCSADLSGLVNIAAGESRTETVSVSLDPAQCAQIRETFTNGFFAEGYLILEGAENCCDISIPLLGYCGDWAALPVYDPDSISPEIRFGDYGIEGILPLAEAIKLVAPIKDEIPSVFLKGGYEEYYDLIEKYGNKNDLLELVQNSDQTAYISPNGDGVADLLSLAFNCERQFKCAGLIIYDSEGNIVKDSAETIGPPRIGSSIRMYAGPTESIEDLPDGEYTAVMRFVIDYPTSEEHPQTISASFTIDNTAPEVESEIVTENGRKILKLTAADANKLDGIYISGTGKGGLADVYEPGSDYQATDYEFAISAIMGALCDFPFYDYEVSRDDACSNLMHLINRNADKSDFAGIDFKDMIPAECDENGSFSIEYDITDLTNLTVDVLDKAYNVKTIEIDKATAEALNEGVWMTKEGFYETTADTIRYISCRDGATTAYTYTFENGVLTLTDSEGNVTTANADVYSDNKMRFSFEDGTAEMLKRYDAETLEDVHFVTLDSVMPKLIENFTAEFETEPTDSNVTFRAPDDVNVILTADETEDSEAIGEIYYVNLLNGTSSSWSTWDTYGTEEGAAIAPGVYCGNLYYYIFNEDNESGSIFDMIAYMDEGKIRNFTYSVDDEGLYTFAFEDDLEQSATVSKMLNGDIVVNFDDMPWNMHLITNDAVDIDQILTLPQIDNLVMEYEFAVTGTYPFMMNSAYNGGEFYEVHIDGARCYKIDPLTGTGTFWNDEVVDLRNPPTLPEDAAYTAEELANMAVVDYEQRTGITPAYATARIKNDGTVSIEIKNENDSIREIYTVDPTTGKGEDLNGNEIDLPQTGITNPDVMITAAAALLMMLTGTAICVKTFRRKEDN